MIIVIVSGGGNQFGVVVEFVLKTHPCPGPATVGLLAYQENAFPEVLRVVQVSALYAKRRLRTKFERMQELSRPNAVLEKVVMMFTRFPPAFKVRTHGILGPLFLSHTLTPPLVF